MVLEKQDSTVIDQFSEQHHVVRHSGAMAMQKGSSDQWETRFYLKEKKGSKFLPGETISCVCVCAKTRTHTPHLALVCLFLFIKQDCFHPESDLGPHFEPGPGPGCKPQSPQQGCPLLQTSRTKKTHHLGR